MYSDEDEHQLGSFISGTSSDNPWISFKACKWTYRRNTRG